MLSDDLEKTINRAVSYANDRQQEYVTLEHLLLALIDDEDALGVLKACNVDVKNLKISLIKYLDQELESITSATVQEAEPSASFQRVLQKTASHVYTSESIKINGANVLVSFFSERESHAVYFLQKQDMSRLDALNFISHGIEKNEDKEEEIEEVMQAHKEFVPSRLVNVPFMTILRERSYKESSVENLPFRSNFIYYVDQVLYAIQDLPDDKRPLKFNLKWGDDEQSRTKIQYFISQVVLQTTVEAAANGIKIENLISKYG